MPAPASPLTKKSAIETCDPAPADVIATEEMDQWGTGSALMDRHRGRGRGITHFPGSDEAKTRLQPSGL